MIRIFKSENWFFCRHLYAYVCEFGRFLEEKKAILSCFLAEYSN